MDIERKTLKEKIENLTQYVRYYNSKSSDKIKKDAKNIVSLTSNIANNIYQTYKDTKSTQEIKSMIMHALSNIKFEGGLGYLFIIDMDGNVYAHVDPKMIDQNIMHIQDVNGKYIVKEFTKVLREKGEGFVDYYWYIVSENRKEMHYKISYVKLLECYDWYIGAGEYLKYMTRDIKKDMLHYIEDTKNSTQEYVYITNSQNKLIYVPKEHKNENINLFIEKRGEGAYQNDTYLTYTDYVAEYDWYVTAVKPLKRIRKDISYKKRMSEKFREKDLQTNFYLMLFSLFVSLLLSLYLSTVINKMLRNYDNKLKETNEKLVFQSRQALLGELLPMIAHQWRQPINKIASILALLRFGLPHKKFSHMEIDNKCQQIEENIEFMSETIDDFRTFYQPKEHPSKVNLKELINKSLEYVEGSIRKKNIQLYKTLEDVSFELFSNEFLQVMMNLVKNAVDALDENGEINVKLFEKENKITISVEDNGKGIDLEHINKIFEPYFTTKEDSMGLGLYMTKIIIEKHLNGEIEAIRLSQGTQINIYFYH